MAYRFNHLHLKTPDAKKTADWYVENFGAKIVSEGKNSEGQSSFRMDLHGVPFNVTPMISSQDAERQLFGMEHIAIDTDTYEEDIARMKAGGIKILEENILPDGRHICFFEGPEGVQVEFLEIKN